MNTEKLTAAALSLIITGMGLALVTAPVRLAGTASVLTGAHAARVTRTAPATRERIEASTPSPAARAVRDPA